MKKRIQTTSIDLTLGAYKVNIGSSLEPVNGKYQFYLYLHTFFPDGTRNCCYINGSPTFKAALKQAREVLREKNKE